ncbi:MAG TPA: alpha/beta hydrolase [Gemmatimonadales bacterium]|nr:alpha/beta hydrolase [Gemmatimonadales bacterium]
MNRTCMLFVVGLAGAGALRAQAPLAKPAIILVHGAFADASGFSNVIRILQKDGYLVTAVQNPLSSFTDDVATTKRLIDAQTGPVVVVGHSYGGAVITTAAASNPNVKALVYLAAFGPDSGERVDAYLEKFPTQLGTALRPDAAGFLYMDRAMFHSVFAADLPAIEADVAAAAQKPIHGSSFGASSPLVAWKTIPSWYVVAQDDRALNPDLERFYAKRMRATTTEIKSSHVVFISHAPEVARVIERAAGAK